MTKESRISPSIEIHLGLEIVEKLSNFDAFKMFQIEPGNYGSFNERELQIQEFLVIKSFGFVKEVKTFMLFGTFHTQISSTLSNFDSFKVDAFEVFVYEHVVRKWLSFQDVACIRAKFSPTFDILWIRFFQTTVTELFIRNFELFMVSKIDKILPT